MKLYRFGLIAAWLFILFSPVLAKRWPGLVLYNLERNSISRKYIIDPAVRIDKGKYSYPVPTPASIFDDPYSQDSLAAYFDRFDREEYPVGRTFQIYSNGNKCGTATVTGLDTVNSCSPVVAEVETSTD